MYHRYHMETEGTCSKVQGLSFSHYQDLFLRYPVISLEHRYCLGIGNYHKLRVSFKHKGDKGRMVRFHMIDNQIVNHPSFYNLVNIGKEFLLKT